MVEIFISADVKWFFSNGINQNSGSASRDAFKNAF